VTELKQMNQSLKGDYESYKRHTESELKSFRDYACKLENELKVAKEEIGTKVVKLTEKEHDFETRLKSKTAETIKSQESYSKEINSWNEKYHVVLAARDQYYNQLQA
jgi:hypothetical protein